MTWTVVLHDEFESELLAINARARIEIIAVARLLETVGPQLGRPYADTLQGSQHANMKELRTRVGREVWRVAFAFDLERQAVLLVAGNKQGKDQKRFYKRLIEKADSRFTHWLSKS